MRPFPPKALWSATVLLTLLTPPVAEAFDPQRGVAAVYDARRFAGRTMANGRPFDPGAPTAAHRHLPFGTEAEVTNLRTGARTRVTITDRGPFTRGRIIDLSPHSARQLGMNGGLARVEIRPVRRPASGEGATASRGR
jgi:rare lipoprotein A